MTTLTVDDGTVVELGTVLAKAGEGSISITGAGVGGCIHREDGAFLGDGHRKVVVRPAECWSSDATDVVILRTDDADKCTGHRWVSDTQAGTTVALCLDKP